MSQSQRYRAVVIGAGVVGLAAAWHLLRLGCRPVAVLERFRIGHSSGSSHGSARMTRSTYATPAYAALMRHVRGEEWPRLERAAGATLVHPADVVFFGPDRVALRAYAAAVEKAGVAVERVSLAEARQRFPSLRFPDDGEILQDRTGGVIAAEDTIRALARLVGMDGGVVLEDTRVRAVEPDADLIRVVSEHTIFQAERVVVAAGAWVPELVPVTRGAVTVVPQTVAYVRLAVPARRLPSWVHFGDAPRHVTYALPEVGRDALKVGHHATKGPAANPDAIAPPRDDEVASIRDALGEILGVPVLEMLGSERCLYSMTPTEDFVIDRWPGEPRIVYASACSGHGFKFAPLTGRLLAELAVHGKADLPTGGDVASMFALQRDAGQPAIGAVTQR
ncbi:MAG TPA: FAD-dependent oxidoreductase [Candidatus Methylomirabilis sp.]|nr:FAD-dependent oxidoreductase [Candidatus Methylomirabilis sp.]